MESMANPDLRLFKTFVPWESKTIKRMVLRCLEVIQKDLKEFHGISCPSVGHNLVELDFSCCDRLPYLASCHLALVLSRLPPHLAQGDASTHMSSIFGLEGPRCFRLHVSVGSLERSHPDDGTGIGRETARGGATGVN